MIEIQAIKAMVEVEVMLEAMSMAMDVDEGNQMQKVRDINLMFNIILAKYMDIIPLSIFIIKITKLKEQLIMLRKWKMILYYCQPAKEMKPISKKVGIWIAGQLITCIVIKACL